jgi:prolyl-tRNA editing enzyme YbaK/EbsC (Cys-tRNA(Pro) deacylase)
MTAVTENDTRNPDIPRHGTGRPDTSRPDTRHPNVSAIDAILGAAGVPGRVQLLSDAATTAASAAAQLGVEVGAIANSLVFVTETDQPVLVMTSGAHRVDTAKAAAALDVATLNRASAEAVYAATGQRIGGVAPVGHPDPLPTLIDRDLAQYPQIWAAGGIAHAVFPMTFDELITLTGGRVADVA